MSKNAWDDRDFVDLLVQQSRALDAKPVPPALERRIMAGFDAVVAPHHNKSRPSRFRLTLGNSALGHSSSAQRILDAVWPGVPLWQPVAALAFSLICGLTVGGLLPSTGSAVATSDTLQISDIATDQELSGESL